MLKYKHILDNLSISQKVRLLTDAGALEDIEFKALGIPSVKFGDFNKYCERSYPSIFSVANAYDRELFYKVAKAVFIDMSRDGVNCAVIKGPKIKINPYDNSYSEDVELTVAMVGEILRAAADTSMAACLTDFNVSRLDAEWMDKKPNKRIIRDYIVKPFERVLSFGSCIGLFTENLGEQSPYYCVNEELCRLALDGGLRGFNGFLLKERVAAHLTVQAICGGQICLDASANILKAAADKYLAMKDGISKGKVTVGELIAEEESGNAISARNIDLAVERLIDFAAECNKTHVSLLNTDVDAPELCDRCYRESTVLLKSLKDVLPVSPKQTVGIIGDIINYPDGEARSLGAEIYTAYLESVGYAVTGYAAGYELGYDLSKSGASAACELAKSSDKIIVFLGKTREGEKNIARTENLQLDANQMHLAESLASYKHKAIYVLCGSYALDAAFTNYASAVILASGLTEKSVMQAIKVALGLDNAEGKLSKPMYFNTDSFEKGKIYRKYHGELVGAFMGYRYVNTAGLCSSYSLGSGFVPARFRYSNFKVTDKSVSFNVKNTSKRPASDIIQLYISAQNFGLALPKKELVGFEKISLAGGESRSVTIEYTYSLYDEERGEYILPSGEYRLCLGSSIDEELLSARIKMGGDELSCEAKEKLSDYLQSESNIVSDKYTLEANYKLMKKSYRNIVSGAGAMLLAVILALFSMAAGINSMFIYIISAILLGAGVVFFVLHGVDATKLLKMERERIDAENKGHFADAEKIPVFSAEQMFVKEFDGLELQVADNNDAIDYTDDEYLKYVNKEFKFGDLVRDFDLFAKEKGYKLDGTMIAEIFSALASSRLVITKMDDEYYTALVTLLCEYLESPVCIDRVDEGYTTEDSVLYKTLEDSTRVKTNAMRGLEYAQKSLRNMFIISLTNVSFESISDYFVPYAKYIRNPLSNIYVNYQDEYGANKRIAIAKNVWFMFNIASTEKAYDMPTYLGEVSALQSIEFTRCAPAGINPDLNKLKFYQFEYMLDKSRNQAVITEDTWKKIDRLESAIGGEDSRRITNKLTVGFERYVNVYALCGGDSKEGFYKALNTKLLPYFAAESCDVKFISVISEALETIFGEENVQSSLRSLKANSK